MKKYKESFFNVDIADYDDKKLIFNTCTRALALFDKESLSKFRGVDVIDSSKTHFNGEIDNGFVVDYNKDEIKEYLDKCYTYAHNVNESLFLTIVPSLACNYRCKYCFEEKILSSSKRMSDEVVDNTITFVKKYLIDNNCKSLSIEWFGGEPLLQKDIIFKIAPELVKFCDENNIIFRSHMVSNGFLITEELADRLINDCRISMIQITLDGLANTYSEMKQCDKSAFYKVIDNIKLLEKYHIKVNIRINVGKDSIEDIKPLLIYLYESEDSIKSGCCLADVRDYNNNSYASESFFDFKKDLYDWAKKDHERIFKHLDLKLPNPRLSSCKATSKEMLTIDYQGRLYQCAHMIDRFETSGTLIDGINEESKERIQALDNSLPYKCINCKFLPICLGNCYVDRVFEGIELNCEAHTKDIINTIKLWYEVEKSTKNTKNN